MSTKAQVKTPAKMPAAPAVARTPQHPVAVPEHEVEQPDVGVQLESAVRLGHSLEAVRVDSSAPPIIQRQEIPEEEEEELQLKREPAAVQRQELPEEEEELMMKRDDQRMGPQGGQVPPEVEAGIRRARGGGQPLEGALQEQMSASLGHDFSGVRVHTDAEADALNQQLTAKAFTTGRDLFFRRGAYEPGSRRGRDLIAHELSHVVQQSTGRVHGGGRGVTVRPAGDSFEQEAQSAARRLRTQYGATDPDRHHMSGRQTTEDRTQRRVMPSQLSPIDRTNGRSVQRDCWEMAPQQQASFMVGAEITHEPDNPHQVYWRMQPDPHETQSCFFAPVVAENEGNVLRIAGQQTVTQGDRGDLAVLHEWVPNWRHLVLYHVTSPARRRAYWGRTGAQRDEFGNVYHGGAYQAVFPPGRQATILQTVPVAEVGQPG
jgi:hypothetical protein